MTRARTRIVVATVSWKRTTAARMKGCSETSDIPRCGGIIRLRAGGVLRNENLTVAAAADLYYYYYVSRANRNKRA